MHSEVLCHIREPLSVPCGGETALGAGGHPEERGGQCNGPGGR